MNRNPIGLSDFWFGVRFWWATKLLSWFASCFREGEAPAVGTQTLRLAEALEMEAKRWERDVSARM